LWMRRHQTADKGDVGLGEAATTVAKLDVHAPAQ
jgi:hypothetical protein